MAVVIEKIVTEDLNVGYGPVTVTNPAGGTLSGNKLNVGRLRTGYTLTYAASLTIDLVNGDWQTTTLTGDVTDSTITVSSGSLFKGAELLLEIIQDATGGRLFNWPTTVLNGGSFPIDTTANYRSLFGLLYNGTNWIIIWNAVTTA